MVGKLIESVCEEIDCETTEDYESSTTTVHTFKTGEETVVVRWIGSSNGYYSESVDLADLTFESDDELLPPNWDRGQWLKSEDWSVVADYWEQHGNETKMKLSRARSV